MLRAVSGSNTEEVLQSRGIGTVSKSRSCSLVIVNPIPKPIASILFHLQLYILQCVDISVSYNYTD
jgi:hypothetical protein